MTKQFSKENLRVDCYLLLKCSQRQCTLLPLPGPNHLIQLKLHGSFPANPANDQRVANAVTLKSTFCLPLNQQSLFKKI